MSEKQQQSPLAGTASDLAGADAAVELKQAREEIAALQVTIAQLRAQVAERAVVPVGAALAPAVPAGEPAIVLPMALPMADIDWNLEGLITSWNAGAERMLGWPGAEALGRSVLSLLTAAEPATEAMLRSTILQGRLGDSYGHVQTKGGSQLRCQWRNVIERDSEGQALSVRSRIIDLTLQPARDDELRKSILLMQTVLDNAPSIVFVKDGAGRYLLTSQHLEHMYKSSREQILGSSDYDFWPREVAEGMRERDAEVAAGKRLIQFEEAVPQPDGIHTFATVKFPIFNLNGGLIGVCGIATDITERKRGEQERKALQEQVIVAQEIALREMSTPLIPVADGLLVMPLIGTIDQTRARQILESLLEGVVRQRSRFVILDMTGVREADAQVASTLVQAACASRLLGVQVILTGISPAMAQALVGLNAELTGIATLSTLQSGIAYALQKIQQ